MLGANPAVWMYSSGPAFAGILFEEGNEEQKKIAEIAVEKQWGSTMVLTEPDAGSDVGAGRTKAVAAGGRLLAHRGREALHHLRRARHVREHPPLRAGPPRGRRPRHQGPVPLPRPEVPLRLRRPASWASATASYATNVEHKMGLKASNTCEMTFGDRHPAKGWLIGDKHDGIRQMFRIIEFARMMVGTKAIATLSTGYLNALEYAKERVQGTDLAQFMDKTAPKVTITHHPDVRRSLMTQKAYAEGMRALVLYTASVQDAIQVKEAAGEDATAAATASTTCCCRSSRATAPRRPTSSSPSRCRPSAAPATSRSTRSSSTSGTPRSTPCTRAPRRSRARTSSSGRSSATRAPR